MLNGAFLILIEHLNRA